MVWGPVGGIVGGLRGLEVFPGAQQRGIVDQGVEQLPAGTDPPMAGGLAGLNP